MDKTLDAFLENIEPFPNRTVSLVGLGPGDPSLITVKAAVRLRQAEAVFYDFGDRPWAIWDLLTEGVERTLVPCELLAGDIVEMIRSSLESGRRVVYLTSGDPMVFERVDSIAEALTVAGYRIEIVPGITSAHAAAAYAGIPLAGHDGAKAVCLAAAGSHHDPEISPSSLASMARSGTLVLYVAEEHIERLCRDLLDHGLNADTPAAIIENATDSDQRVVSATLSSLLDEVVRVEIRSPALLFLGEHAIQRSRLAWFKAGGS